MDVKVLFRSAAADSAFCAAEWEGYCDAIPEGERGDFVGAYNKRLMNEDDPLGQVNCTKHTHLNATIGVREVK